MNISNPITVIIIYISVFIFPGYLILNFFDNNNFFYFYAFGNNIDFNFKKFYVLIFISILPILLYMNFVLRKSINDFKNKEIEFNDPTLFWKISVMTLSLINLYFLYLFNFSIPFISVSSLISNENYALFRAENSSIINQGIFNLSFYFLGFFSIMCGMILIKKSYLYLITSTFLCLFLSMFVLAKSPIFDLFFLSTIGYLFLKKNSINIIYLSIPIFIALYSIFSIFNGEGFDFQSIVEGLNARLFFGEIGDLASYLYFFSENPINIFSALPTYIQEFFGYSYLPAAKIIANNTTGLDALLTAGYYNTIFIGESYAIFGNLGFYLGPLVIIANLFLINILLKKSHKNIISILFFPYIMFKFCKGIFSGIGLFIFSTNQILIIMFIFYLFFYNNSVNIDQ